MDFTSIQPSSEPCTLILSYARACILSGSCLTCPSFSVKCSPIQLACSSSFGDWILSCFDLKSAPSSHLTLKIDYASSSSLGFIFVHWFGPDFGAWNPISPGCPFCRWVAWFYYHCYKPKPGSALRCISRTLRIRRLAPWVSWDWIPRPPGGSRESDFSLPDS